jgi:DNA-binding response OmpR family regulator
MNIVIIDADDWSSSSLAEGLQQFGHQARPAASAREGLLALSRLKSDLVIMELNLPDADGFDLLHHLRKADDELPVMVLTVRDTLPDRVQGLNSGADDYLIKPVALEELEARVRALARRQRPPTRLGNGPLLLDTDPRQATLAGKPLDLTRSEWQMLELLVRHTDQVIRKETLTSCFRKSGGEVTDNAVEVFIYRLRAKLKPHIQIRTVHGYGYLLEPATSPA